MLHTTHLLGRGCGVHRPRARGRVGHGIRLGKVNSGVQGAGSVDEGRDDLTAELSHEEGAAGRGGAGRGSSKVNDRKRAYSLQRCF